MLHRSTLRHRLLVPPMLGLALVAGACGDSDDGGAITPTTGDGSSAEPQTEITLVAKDIEWDLDQMTVPVGQEITITVDNQDSGVPHNLRVRGDGLDEKSDVENGPITQTLVFTVDAAGTYEFICDVHPNMVGELVAVDDEG